MKGALLPKLWEDIMNAQAGLPIVVHSVQKIMDSKWYKKTASVHKHFELVYTQKGEASFYIAGEKVGVRPNDILLIKPYQEHRLDVAGNNVCSFSVLKFCFSGQGGRGVSTVSMADFLSFVSGLDKQPYIRISSRHGAELALCLRRIMAEGEKNEEYGDFLSSLLVMELFVRLSRALKSEWEDTLRGKRAKLYEMMESARAFIDENYTQNIGLSDMSSYIYLSPSHFAREFKKAFSISPVRYLLTKRVERAKLLLLQTEDKVGAISEAVGFQAQQRFNDMFKKLVGTSPGEYRKRFRRLELNR